MTVSVQYTRRNSYILYANSINYRSCYFVAYSNIVELKGHRQLVLTITTSGSCVIACPLTILIGNMFPSLSIVFTRVSSPSSHICATSRPAFTKPPGLLRRSSMYECTP
ncbi:hypothetical protein V8G54_030848 [Vigna mungo]|uniref:Uncharacterized protein n=1 Tax=Vigna mungo TaxID=3915 RepID=A0AAQ3RMS5_VIGMU